MLLSLKEAHELFTREFEEFAIALSKFCSLRPFQVKLFKQIPNTVCVCQYHENICLILTVPEQHTNLPTTFSGFVSQVTCEEENQDCIYCRCNIFKDSLEIIKPSHKDSQTLIKHQQCKTPDKPAEKVTILTTVNDIFDELTNQMSNFLVHRYIKRKQQDHFTKLTEEFDGSSAALQVDFSENASIVNQNEIQSAHWSHQQVTIFTDHVWVNQNVKESFVIFLII